jgi:beta-glucosidase
VFGRGYPKDVVDYHVAHGRLASAEPAWLKPGDEALMGVATDFLGINYYSRAIIRSDAVPDVENEPRLIPEPTPDQCTDMGWEVCPDALRGLLVQIHEDYSPPAIVVTENGAAYPAGPNQEGVIQDSQRIAYFDGHIHGCQEAIDQGVPLTGYFAWSLLDNFEWAFGYAKRFGIVYVDYETQKRTPKASARWFQSKLSEK